MNTQVLVDAIVRQTTVLIAQLATSHGLRAPLAHLANQVFLDLSRELEAQGVSRKVSADMFGMALRAYLKKLQRLGESSTDRGRSLWEAVYGHLRTSGIVSRDAVFKRFALDDETLVRGALHDLTESGLVFSSGSGADVVYRAASDEELGQLRALGRRGIDDLVWAIIYNDGPIARTELARLGGINGEVLDGALLRLLDSGRIEQQESGGNTYFARAFFVDVGAESGWEAAVFDHFHAVVKTVCAKLQLDHRSSEALNRRNDVFRRGLGGAPLRGRSDRFLAALPCRGPRASEQDRRAQSDPSSTIPDEEGGLLWRAMRHGRGRGGMMASGSETLALRRLGLTVLLGAVALLPGCATPGDEGSESSFVACKIDADCPRSGETCIAGRCMAAVRDAGTSASLGDASTHAGPGDASSSASGAVATAPWDPGDVPLPACATEVQHVDVASSCPSSVDLTVSSNPDRTNVFLSWSGSYLGDAANSSLAPTYDVPPRLASGCGAEPGWSLSNGIVTFCNLCSPVADGISILVGCATVTATTAQPPDSGSLCYAPGSSISLSLSALPDGSCSAPFASELASGDFLIDEPGGLYPDTTPGAGIPHMVSDDPTGCALVIDGWYFDDPVTPHEIRFCPQSCHGAVPSLGFRSYVAYPGCVGPVVAP